MPGRVEPPRNEREDGPQSLRSVGPDAAWCEAGKVGQEHWAAGAGGGIGWAGLAQLPSREPGGGHQIVVGSWSVGGGKRRQRMSDTCSGSLAAKREEGSGPSCWVERKVLGF